MAKFQKGDKVRVTKKCPQIGWVTDLEQYVNDDKVYTIDEIIPFYDQPWYTFEESYGDTHWEFPEESLQMENNIMKKFKIGDKVKIVRKIDTSGWVSPTMDNMINDGKIYTIANNTGSFYSLGNERYGFPEEAMEFANLNEVKVDIKLETQADCYKALLDGYILRDKFDHTEFVKLVNGKQESSLRFGTYCFDSPCNWEAFEEVEHQWFDNIPESGILCNVRDYEGDPWVVDIIEKYIPDSMFPFCGRDDTAWGMAIPYTKEELRQFINSAPE